MGQAPGGYRQDTGCGEGRHEGLDDPGRLESAAPEGEETGLICGLIRHSRGRAVAKCTATRERALEAVPRGRGRGVHQNGALVNILGCSARARARGNLWKFYHKLIRLFRAGAGAGQRDQNDLSAKTAVPRGRGRGVPQLWNFAKYRRLFRAGAGATVNQAARSGSARLSSTAELSGVKPPLWEAF